MSEFRGPLSAVGVPIAEGIAAHRAKPPYEKKLAGIGWAAALMAWCFYLRPAFVSPIWRAPFAASEQAWLTAGVWAAAVIVAGLALMAALHGVRGVRDWWSAFWRLLLAGACAALLWLEAYPADWPFAAFLLKGLYWAWLAAQLARFWAAAQLFTGGAAVDVVESAIADGEFDWDEGRRARWWPFRKRRRS